MAKRQVASAGQCHISAPLNAGLLLQAVTARWLPTRGFPPRGLPDPARFIQSWWMLPGSHDGHILHLALHWPFSLFAKL